MQAEYRRGDRVVANVGSISKGRMNTKPGYVVIDNKKIMYKELT